jgi:hypothetical protein
MPESLPSRLLRPAVPLFPESEISNFNHLVLIRFSLGRARQAAALERSAKVGRHG